MRSFDRPGDLKILFQELRSKVWKNVPKVDQALFFQFLQGIPAGYGTTHEVTQEDLDAYFKWQWWRQPLDLGYRTRTPETSRHKYWDGGMKLAKINRVNGWLFRPDMIQIEYFDATRLRKEARCATITSILHGAESFDATSDDLTLAHSLVAYTFDTLAEWNIFVGVGLRINKDGNIQSGVLLPTFLIKHEDFGELQVNTFTGLAVGNFIKLQMLGRWYFEPRLLEEDVTADD